ncbi:MAG: hypothetical protein Q8N26_32430 [Myxococcales bacterium]|nr:hypothetical protein [Myxococcales bacterium]
MKWFGGIVVGAWALLHGAGLDRLPDEDRGELPADVRRAPGGILMWHSGFMGGK